MKFTKMQGAGNDYVFIDARSIEADWASLSRRMSDRHFGVGGDGIILILPSDVADLKMRMFNADGSEGEMCRQRDPLFRQVCNRAGRRRDRRRRPTSGNPRRSEDGDASYGWPQGGTS